MAPNSDEGTERPAGAEIADRQRGETASDATRIALFLFDCQDPSALRKTLDRIPAGAWSRLKEVVVMVGASEAPEPLAIAGFPDRRVVVHRLPRRSEPGSARKAAFEYALRRKFSHVVALRGDGAQPPETLPELLEQIREDPDRVVVATRMKFGHRPRGLSMLRWLVHALANGTMNRILGLRLGDYDSGLRAYPCAALERVRYQLNSGDRQFDTQILVQLRVLGVPIDELLVLPAWREFDDDNAGVRHLMRSFGTAIDYRLHQLHVTRRGRFFVDEDIHYTLKLSATGSHMQVIDAIDPGSRVLDLGCSQGLLAKPLSEKSVRVVGVDIGPPNRLSGQLEDYFQRDLDAPLDLPLQRDFDYVVCSDVIEHLRNRRELLVGARRFLKEGGRLIISTPNIALWFYRLSLLAGRFEYGPRGVLDETHVHLFTRATFRREVERAGFHVVSERVTALPFELVFRSTGRSRLVLGISRFYHALARLWPEMFAYQMVLEAVITTLDEESTSR